ncbi:copper amine oxidase N-terminal domain-containing protein [Paenibacillus tarimensis]|uniref:copper amine oxidase N-terminal domain-containing protein n=1 Tax=Paenibacillus tarimensis TaxID=416012 RepID=UPI001F2FC930|nr:copper amine oxidase N-terminal domain-containing protein [Paenibacillus tarimensis]MCF2945365.1 copper amine oxidase N-terminal domain-containing protein [Paenibacillus tarimensis]
MRKQIIVCLAMLLLISSLISLLMPQRAYAAASPVSVFVDFRQVPFDVEPVNVKGTTLVQFRPLFEAMGMDVSWDSSERLVTGTQAGLTIDLTINEQTAQVNGRAVKLDQPARIIDGSTMVPLRFIGEATGAVVYWDGTRREISVISEAFLESLGITKEEMEAKLSGDDTQASAPTAANPSEGAGNSRPADSGSPSSSGGKTNTSVAEPPASKDDRKPAQYGSGDYKAASGKPDLKKLRGMYTGMRADQYGYECGGLCMDMFTFFAGSIVFVGEPPYGGPETIDCERDGCQTYTIKNGKMQLNGGESYSILVTKDGKLKINNVQLEPVQPVAEGMTLKGEYIHKGYFGLAGVTSYSSDWTETLILSKDGTFESDDLSLGTLNSGQAVTNSAADREDTGIYRISGNTIILEFDDGQREQVFFEVLENTKRAKGEDLVIGNKNFYVDRKE